MELSARRFEELYGKSTVACYLLSGEMDGLWQVVYANARGKELMECTILPAPVEIVFSPLPDAFIERLHSALERAVADSWLDMFGRTHRELSFNLAPMPDGTFLLTAGADSDTVETLRAMLDSSQKELRIALQEANEASAAKTRFLSSMSHDIRTPMNAIVGMTDIALAHQDDPARMVDCLRKVKLASGHLLDILNDVLDMSRIESGRMELHEDTFSLGDLLHQLCAIIRQRAGDKGLDFQLELGEVLHEEYVGDATRIQQILINILGNAVKFTPRGGQVVFSIRETIVPWKDTSDITFVVKDTGMGMDEEFLKRVFQPFERAENVWTQKIEGTGLGMSIAKQLVDNMHGTIEVTSQVGKGSVFTVTLPLRPVQTQSDHDLWLYMGQCALLWNREGLCTKMEDFLVSQGMFCRVHTEADTLEAAAAAMDAEGILWGVITDGAPDDPAMLAMVRRLKQRLGQSLPVLLITASDWSEAGYTAAKAGVDDCLPYPLFRTALLADLARLSRRQDMSKQRPVEEKTGDFRTKRLLLVEDNELNMEIACEVLKETGILLDTAENGKEAVEKFQESAPFTYDLILMDVQMPIMDGHEATRRIRALPRPDASRVPIVAMTANAFAEDAIQAKQCGMTDFLSKPLDVDKLYQMMNKLLG